MAVINPVGPNIRVDTANTVSVATTQQTPYIRVVAVGASHAHVAIATAPNMAATTADFLAVRDVPSVFSIGQVRSQPVVGVTTGTTTAFRVAEGQGSQFVPGQTVMLTDCDTDTADPYWKNLCGITTVSSINTRANFPNNEYPYNVEIIVSTDSSLIQTSISSNARLVSCWRAAALKGTAAGEGFVHCQQVQITGG